MHDKNKEPIRPSTWVIVSIAVIFIAGYFGYQIYQSFQQQIKKQQDLLSKQQQEISDLTDAQKTAQATSDEAQNEATAAQNSAAASQKAAEDAQAKLQQEQTNSPDLSAIITEWSSNVALIVCNFSDGSVDFGSGFLYQYPNDSIVVITNKHVLEEETTGYDAVSCSVEIPGDGNNYYTIINTYPASNNPFHVGNVGDWGYLEVTNGDSYFNSTAENANKNLTICQQQEQTGDNVVVLGYPDYAGQFTNPTATQGIISGYAPPYYTTSAQIESGNSGGVAIDSKKDCYVGIPSAVKIGNYANLGRILNADIPFTLPY